ncbi:MAG: alpha-amylase family glycosyl hydrolase [Tenuifilaceae bacterium]|jgi:glycosidase|nr:alpha-amylase family glycosyl hydrolase [Tenuifilaceae bacterium]
MKRVLFISIAFLLASCGAREVIPHYAKQSEIYGLASVVPLAGEKSEVILEDYFLDVSLIDSVVAPSNFDVLMAADKKSVKLISQNETIPQLSELKVWADGACYSLLMRKSRKLPVEFVYQPKGKQPKTVQLTGQINDWNPSKTNLEKVDGVWKITLLLNPGKYHYQVVIDGKWMLDPANPEIEDNNIGGQNSVLRVGESNPNLLPFIYAKDTKAEKIFLGFENSVDELFVFWENYRLDNNFVTIDESGATITIPANANGLKRSHIRVWAYNTEGESNDLLIPLEGRRAVTSTAQLNRSDLHTQVMYSLMIDRFHNASPDNDHPVDDPEIHPKANYYGGDIAGITRKITDGYFEELGINTIWVSPITQNPLGAYGLYPEPRTKFSGYHGYWPISSSKVDFRFGTSDEVHQMLAEAHKRDINIILDYVANHVHQEHPLYQKHPDWATPLYLPDGTMNTEKWDEHRLTTWFDTFMPTLDLERPEVYEPMTDSALFWVTQYKFDGFRHDATKHIPEVFWRMLTRKIKENVEPNRTIYQIGETYGSHELISSYIGSGMLNGQFDFNVFDAATATFGRIDVPFTNLHSKLIEGFSYYGWNNLMGIITGNHDKGRFISYAGGAVSFDEDAKKAGWTRHIGVGDAVGYKKLQMLNAFNLTIPGVPTIYQGDEFGQPGGNDPDNRKMMQFDDLNPQEQQTIAITKKLTNLRRTNMALSYGTFEPVLVNDKVYAYARTYMGKVVLVVFSNSSAAADIAMELPARFAGLNFSSNFDNEFSKGGEKLSVKLQGFSFEVFTTR